VTERKTIPPALMGILYVGITVVGLYVFHGIPVLNVALGFPLGALLAWQVESRHPPSDERDGPSPADGAAPPGHSILVRAGTLRALLWWALGFAAVTVTAAWVELAASLLALRYPFSLGIAAPWLPLSLHGSAGATKATVFAVAIAPALQVLTTVFGGVVALVVRRDTK